MESRGDPATLRRRDAAVIRWDEQKPGRPSVARRWLATTALAAACVTACGDDGTLDTDAIIDIFLGVDIERFDATPATITPPEVSTLRWRVEHATLCELEPGFGEVDPEQGSMVVAPGRTTPYTLICEELDAVDGHVEGQDRADTTVTVVP